VGLAVEHPQVESEEDKDESDEAGIHPEHGGKTKTAEDTYTNTQY
jgi:hypothetical protein